MSSATLPLEQDVLAAQTGDRRAFTRLVDASKGVVCAIGLAIVRDVSLSEDVAQSVFFDAWRDLGKLRNPASFLPWLRQLARNKAKQSVRGRARSGRRHEPWSESHAPEVADPAADPLSSLIDREEADALAEAIEILPDEAREVVTLYYREGQSAAQVAALLGLSEAAVKKRLERARTVLKAAVLERLEATVRRTAPSAAFTATVVAALAASPKGAAAATGATAKKLAAGPIAKGGIAMIVAALVSVLVAAMALTGWFTPSPRSSEPVNATGLAALEARRDSASATSAADSLDEASRPSRAIHDRARRDEMRARILAAFAEQQAQPPPPSQPAPQPTRGQRETNDVDQFGRFVTEAIREDFVPMARACAKQLVARRPNVRGTVVVSFELLGDTQIGGVVNSADVDRGRSTLADAEFETCVRESLYGVYFDPPPSGGRATLSFPLTVIGASDAAIDEQVEDFHLKDKR